jgi:hypothetical protein
VVSHHLDGFLHRRRVGLLHPTADPGVHRVSAAHRTSVYLVRRLGASPPMPCPSEPSPPVQPYPRRREPLPSCRCGARSRVRRGPTRLQGVAPYEHPLRWTSVAGAPCPLLSWASLPGASRPSSRVVTA